MGTGSSGKSFTSTYRFTPSRSDETSARLNSAAYLQPSARTVTMKNDQGKTMGLERMTRLSDAPPSVKFTAFQQMRITAEDQDSVYIKDGKYYYLHDTQREDFIQSQREKSKVSKADFKRIFQNEISKAKSEKEKLKAMESRGVVVVNYKRR